MTAPKLCALVLTTGFLLTACATAPTGPSVMVLPGSGRSFQQFAADDAVCRDWAAQRVGITPERAGARSGVASAAIATGVGAAAGAAIGAAVGHPGSGAAIGAGSGLLLGSAAGATRGGRAWASAQSRYDDGYLQCMYASGNQIPVEGGSLGRYPSYRASPPPSGGAPRYLPPPPPGPPPPPPPG